MFINFIDIYTDWKWRKQWVGANLLCTLDITVYWTTPY